MDVASWVSSDYVGAENVRTQRKSKNSNEDLKTNKQK
jgi:hypothetical protein